MIDLSKIIKSYDCFGWVPTIRGALSLDLIGGSNALGQTDKYAVSFKRHVGARTEHYIISTSLFTVHDTKVGSEYVRTLRFVFVGSINQESENKSFFDKHSIDDADIISYFANEGVLLGYLTILVEGDDKLTDDEAWLLRAVKRLENKKEQFKEDFYIKAESFRRLQKNTACMFNIWKNIERTVIRISKQHNQNKSCFEWGIFPVYCFDVFLTRDGLLLLNDTTQEIFKTTYVSAECDYKKNVQLHRLFKIAMSYIKHLFHSNYYHNDVQDSYLPASNINPCTIICDCDFKRIFRHQLDSFLTPVVQLRRRNFNDYSIDPQGLLLYAESFIRMFRHNRLVDEETAINAEEYLKIQMEDVKYQTRTNRNLYDFFLNNNSIIPRVTWNFAFVVTVLSVVSTFTTIFGIKLTEIVEFEMQKIELFFVYFCCVLAVSFLAEAIYSIGLNRYLEKHFKVQRNHGLCKIFNSDIKSARLSTWYIVYIKFTGLMPKVYSTILSRIFVLIVLLLLIIATFCFAQRFNTFDFLQNILFAK